ncbi:MAG: tRNA (adenosine(37)-N6)-dimethylallyltransferase MiaA [Phycisphaeraceae bacterium]|nr:tRNA (adenosine(37)-N6)-dimethylallyltransferase MiaA [Phycisphaeraceae bacterium]
MARTSTSHAILLLGPTAGGKSELAVDLAERLHTLTGSLPGVVGADSMQVYRHLDAGTAKPPRKLRDRVPHHMIDIVEPTDRFTVHDWLSRVNPLIDRMQQQGASPIVVGGTNLYIKALLHGMFDGPGIDETFRRSLDHIAAPQLHQRLQTIDSDAADRIKPHDRKRIVRALEVHHQTGRPISALQTQWDSIRHPPSAIRHFTLLGLDWPVPEINQRINLRVKAMFYPHKVTPELAAEICPNGESLPDEAQRLHEAGLLGPQAREALGYKQVLAALRGELTMDEAFERTKILTRRFAKQQRTWLRRFQNVHWLPAAELDPAQCVEAALSCL